MASRVQPILNEGQLRLLMDAQHESETLDYKRELDLTGADRRRVIVELAKDVGAMASGLGGFLCVGLDERGRPTGRFSDDHARELDEARLRPRLERYLPDGIDLRTAVHEIDGAGVGLIYVGSHPDGLVVFRADGIYEANGRQVVVFREGDVFIRRGTQCRRWSQDELRQWMREQSRMLREEAMAEAAAAFRPLHEQAQRTEGVVEGPADALNWSLDVQTLVSAVTDQLRRSDDIPFRLLIDSAPAVARRYLVIDTSQPDETGVVAEDAEAALGGLLDRIASLAARGIALERREIVDPAVSALITIYNEGFDDRGIDRNNLAIPPSRLWLMIVERLYALGALAARKRDWVTIRRIAEARPAAREGDYYESLLRHAHIMAARAGLLEDPEHARVGASLLQLALQHIARLPELRPDATPDDERFLSSLCQFDLLVNVATVDATGRFGGGVLYPHFKRFYSHRSDPAVVALLEDQAARQAIFPQDDQALSNLLFSLGRLASGEFFFISGWDGYSDRRIERLFGQHPPEELPEGL
jgi:hypothetical protein